MAKQRKNHEPRCPECGQVHDGMCRHEEHYVKNDLNSVKVGTQRKTLGGFGNKRS